LTKIDLMKIDVEGYELEVLKSAGEHLGRNILRLVVETHAPQLAERGESVEQVHELLRSRRYRNRLVAGVEVWELGR
jgi:hypothetical protein